MRITDLSTVRTKARLYADERPGGSSAFITDAELDTLINSECAAYWDLLISSGGPDLFESTNTLTFTTASAVLPSDYYQIRSAHIVWSTNDYEEIESLDHIADRDAYLNQFTTFGRGTCKAYTIRVNPTANTNVASMTIYPTPTANTSVEIKYVRTCPVLSANTDPFPAVNNWDRLIARSVACEIRTIAGLPNTFLTKLRDEDVDRITQLVNNRPTETAKVRLVDGKRTRQNRRVLPRYGS